MKKEFISLSIIGAMLLTPSLCFAYDDYNYEAIQPVLQQYPSMQNNTGYQGQYPLPSQQAQQYSAPQQNNGYAPAVSQQPNGYQTQYPVPVNNYQAQGYNTNPNQLQGNVIYVPANTVFPAITTSMISSQTAKAGDGVTFYLGSDFYYNGKLVAAAGSRVNGTIITAKRGGLANKNGKIQIRFSHIMTPTGQMIPITASIETEDGSGILKAGTAVDVTKEYVKDAAIGAGLGAALGTAMGALSGGSVGKGAIYGTAVGGGMGVLSSLIERGGDVEIPQNAQMNIVLDQPITVTSNTPY